MLTERESWIIDLLHREVKPALGCTEPIAVALAAAKAVELLQTSLMEDRKVDAGKLQLDIELSGNILKNGMGVGIPGTGMIGLNIASALGAACGKSRYGLEVLKDLTDNDVAVAKKIVAEKRVRISLADTPHLLYVKATATEGENQAYSIIEDVHDRFVETGVNGSVVNMRPEGAAETSLAETESDKPLTVKEIYSFAKTVDFEEISFILEDRTLNLALAQEGLNGTYGLQVGKAIRENQNEIFGEEFMSFAMGMTAAASDARMAGCKLPAMSNSGSGNQGITVSMPIIAYCIKYDISDEKLARALVLSNLVAIHIKSLLGRLSALCGCVVASSGSACGLVYLQGGTYEQVCAAIKNMIGNITGMVCDGAKVGCAMKVASGVSSAVQSSVLALRGTCVSETDGIIDKDIEKTIQNLGTIGSSGMHPTDLLIQQIMLCK